MSKITLLAEKCYIIRSTRSLPTGALRVAYYMTPAMWTYSPMDATVFMDYTAGEAHLQLMVERDLKDLKGWADGSKEVFDVVPLYGEIMHSPNAIHIVVRRE